MPFSVCVACRPQSERTLVPVLCTERQERSLHMPWLQDIIMGVSPFQAHASLCSCCDPQPEVDGFTTDFAYKYSLTKRMLNRAFGG